MLRPESEGPWCWRCEQPGAHNDDDCIAALRRAVAAATAAVRRPPHPPIAVSPALRESPRVVVRRLARGKQRRSPNVRYSAFSIANALWWIANRGTPDGRYYVESAAQPMPVRRRPSEGSEPH